MRRVLAFVIVAWTSSLALRVSAGGLEYVGAGTQALGRGGAVTARADDPMVLGYNPAGLAELRGNQILVNANLALMDACVDPIGYYGWGAYGGGQASRLTGFGKTLDLNIGDTNPGGPKDAYYTGRLDTVCMRQNITPVPQLGFSFRLTERLGVGFGLIFPSQAPQGQWGGPNGVIDTPAGLRPAPTRYMLLNTGSIGLFPTIGLGFRFTKWLRLGAAFEWGMYGVDLTNMTAAAGGGTSPANDIVSRTRVTDWFVPAVNASIHLVPFDALDIVAAVRVSGDLEAPGTLEITSGLFDSRFVPRTSEERATLYWKLPWKLRGGIRYASRLVPRPDGTGAGEGSLEFGPRVGDAMENERWDIELDVEYQLNARASTQRVVGEPNQFVIFETPGGMISPTPFPSAPRIGASTDIVLPKNWKNQISARLGGTYNVLPGRLAFSLGAHYENRGVDPSYMQIDFWPVSRIGLHAGVKIRVAKRIDFVASYAHIFQETITVSAPGTDADTGQNIWNRWNMTGQVDAIDKHVGTAPRGMTGQFIDAPVASADGVAAFPQILTKGVAGAPPSIVNAGTYRSSIDVVSLGVNVHY